MLDHGSGQGVARSVKFMAVGDLLVIIRGFMVGSSVRMGAARFRVTGGARLQMVSEVESSGNRKAELHQKQYNRQNLYVANSRNHSHYPL